VFEISTMIENFLIHGPLIHKMFFDIRKILISCALNSTSKILHRCAF